VASIGLEVDVDDATSEPLRRRVPAHDVELAVTWFGAGRPGVPLVVVHGYTGAGRDWHKVVDRLATDRPVVTFDQRGHGESSWGPPGGYTRRRLGADLVELLDALEIGRAHVLGHSLGGLVALDLTLDHPDRVASLLAVDTAAATVAEIDLASTEQLADHGRRVGMPAVVAEMIKGLDEAEGPPLLSPQAREAMIYTLGAVDPEVLTALADELNHYDVVGRLGEITCPTTVVVGSEDHLRGAADELAEGIDGARLVVLDGAGHNPQLEARRRLRATIADHLQLAESRHPDEPAVEAVVPTGAATRHRSSSGG
jgi:pimeloyl-ACP methyl ester carboxylesterase